MDNKNTYVVVIYVTKQFYLQRISVNTGVRIVKRIGWDLHNPVIKENIP